MLSAIDFTLLKKTIAWTTSIVLITLCIVFYAYQERKENEQALLDMQQTFDNLGLQIQDLNHRQQIIARFENDFKLIEQHHFLQPENRLAWIEQVKKSTEALKLSNLKYLIDPQQKLVGGTTLELFYSKMKLNTSLFHEGDLVTLLNDLDHPEFGIHAITQCEIERKSEERNSAVPENFSSQCEMDWFTAKPVEAVIVDPDDMDGMI